MWWVTITRFAFDLNWLDQALGQPAFLGCLGQEVLLVFAALLLAELAILVLELLLPAWLGPLVLELAPCLSALLLVALLEGLGPGKYVVWDIDVHKPGVCNSGVVPLLWGEVLEEVLEPAIEDHWLLLWHVLQS